MAPNGLPQFFPQLTRPTRIVGRLTTGLPQQTQAVLHLAYRLQDLRQTLLVASADALNATRSQPFAERRSMRLVLQVGAVQF